MKKLLLMLTALLSMTSVSAANDGQVTVSGFTFDVSDQVKSEIGGAKWAFAFRLENTSSQYGDACLCGTYEGLPYISSPDGSQEYVVSKEGLTRVLNVTPEFSDDWAEKGEKCSNKMKYAFGYDTKDNVFVVVFKL